MTIKWSNNGSTTLASSISSSATTITVVPDGGSLFPVLGAGDYFYATLVDASNNIEIVKVTARTGDVMTVVRGQESTVPNPYVGGDKFELRPTAGGLADLGSGINITALDGVVIGDSDPKDGTFENLDVTGIASGVTPAPTDSSTKFATTEFVVARDFPSGGIIMWSGSVETIPSGWALCNGAAGTPDLRDRFIVGAGSTYNPGSTGGSKDAIVVSHTHTFSGNTNSTGSHRHGLNGYAGGSLARLGYASPVVAALSGYINQGQYVYDNSGYDIMEEVGSHSHSVSGTTSSSGSSGTNANLPPYYALCFIMKV